MAKIGVYKIYFETDKNNKVYIGISNNLTRRKTDHLNNLLENSHKNKFLQNAYKKYGVENFRFEVLEICDIDSLVNKEEDYIKKYNSFNNKRGYNLTSGGEHKRLSESTKKKLSKVKSGKKLSDKTKTKLVIHNLLKNRPELKIEVVDGKVFVEGKEYKKSSRGKFRTPQDDIEFNKRKILKSKWQSDFAKKLGTNRVKSKEEIEKIRSARLGSKASDETKKKIGSYHRGKKITDKHREGIKEKLGIKVIIEKDNEVMVFKSKKECGRFLQVSDCTVDKYLNTSKKLKNYLIKN